MVDYYSALGINRDASSEDIKKAFKSLAMKHHPDRGGDAKKFQEINEAYSTLSDPQKKAMYDRGPDPVFGSQNHGGFHDFSFHFGGNPLDPFQSMMDQFGFVFRSGNPNIPPKNKDLHIRCRISLKDSYLGKQMNVSYNLPSGRAENLDLNIPPGVESGQNLKVTGYGDDSISNIPRGDLTVTIEVDRDPRFRREEFNLITKLDIDVFDAMLGCTKKILNIDDKEIEVTIRPGTQHGQKYSCKGLGFRNIRFTNTIGDLLVEVNVKTLTSNNPNTINQIQQLASLMRQESN